MDVPLNSKSFHRRVLLLDVHHNLCILIKDLRRAELTQPAQEYRQAAVHNPPTGGPAKGNANAET
jgi:hypothetical protein